VLTALPLYHIFAFTANLLCFFDIGGRNILIPSPRTVQNLRRAIENYPITWITGVNTLVNGLRNEEWFTAFQPRQLKAAIAGGTALHHAVAMRWELVTGTRIAEGFGLTECSPVVSFNPLEGAARRESIGVPVPGTEVRLVDDAGVPVAPGEPGELIVRGPQNMKGYWQRPDETALVLRDGWLYTGDVGVMDADGYFSYQARNDDMIISAGYNIAGPEVEGALMQHPAVAECGVVGAADAERGQVVMAFVVLKAGLTGTPELEKEIQEFVKQTIAPFKYPRRVEFCTSLPRTETGKLQRFKLRQQASAFNTEQ
jgi:long-chain acyl-CoA synthetase